MIQINLLSGVPIYEQLYTNIVNLILQGVIKSEEQLPSVRMLAKELGVNPNTVQKAYQELERNNYIYTIAGKGNFAALVPVDRIQEQSLEQVKLAVENAIQHGVEKTKIIQFIEELLQMRNE